MSDLVCSTGPLGKNMWTVDGEFQAVLDLSSFCQGFESPSRPRQVLRAMGQAAAQALWRSLCCGVGDAGLGECQDLLL